MHGGGPRTGTAKGSVAGTVVASPPPLGTAALAPKAELAGRALKAAKPPPPMDAAAPNPGLAAPMAAGAPKPAACAPGRFLACPKDPSMKEELAGEVCGRAKGEEAAPLAPAAAKGEEAAPLAAAAAKGVAPAASAPEKGVWEGLAKGDAKGDWLPPGAWGRPDGARPKGEGADATAANGLPPAAAATLVPAWEAG